MNCKEANEILITDFLFSLGIEPKRVTGNSYWYLSPLREENTPSFKVDSSINRWYDHGMGIGGKLVDLGIRIFEIDVVEFLKKINVQDFSNSFSFQKPESKASSPVIKKIKEIENKALVGYLTDRAIDPIWMAQLFCKEVYFSANSKNYFGIGFKNDLGGYEIRSRYFKGCIGPKAITSIGKKTSKTVVLFEGFFDFLSAYQQGWIITDFSFIILNSVNQISRAIEELRQYNPDLILSYLDNDEAGKKCFAALKAAFPDSIDRSHQYADFKDVNEMVTYSLTNSLKHKNQNK